jgi:hypothetical protein
VVGLVDPVVGDDAHTLAERQPLEHPLPPVDLGALGLGGGHIGDDAALGEQEPALGLEHGQGLVRKPVAGEALGQFLAGQHLVGQLVLEAGLQ